LRVFFEQLSLPTLNILPADRPSFNLVKYLMSADEMVLRLKARDSKRLEISAAIRVTAAAQGRTRHRSQFGGVADSIALISIGI